MLPSPRIRDFVDRLPLRPGMLVLEIGCGPGAAARLVVQRIGDGRVLAIDRSARAIEQATRGCRPEIESGRLRLRQIAIEEFSLTPGEPRFDLVFAMRVGAFDGRHPDAAARALAAVAGAIAPRGRFFVDGGDPLREIVFTRRARHPRPR
jgi:cyclopropane fatty-acyl-phospholipid synthase-like methyltransferase